MKNRFDTNHLSWRRLNVFFPDEIIVTVPMVCEVANFHESCFTEDSLRGKVICSCITPNLVSAADCCRILQRSKQFLSNAPLPETLFRGEPRQPNQSVIIAANAKTGRLVIHDGYQNR